MSRERKKRSSREDDTSTESRRRLSSGYGSSSPRASARSPPRPSPSDHHKRHRSDRRQRAHSKSRSHDEHHHRRRRSRSSSNDARHKLYSARDRRRSRTPPRRHHNHYRKVGVIHGKGLVQFVNKKWAAVLCSDRQILVAFHVDDQPFCSVGDSVLFNAAYVDRRNRPPLHDKISYYAYEIKKKRIVEKVRKDEDKDKDANIPEFVLDTDPVAVGSQKSARAADIEYEQRESSRAVLDISAPTAGAGKISHPRMSSVDRELRSKRYEPTVALKDRKGVIRMKGKWPIIVDKKDGHRVFLYPELLRYGKPEDGMFVRYSAQLSARKEPRCNYNALSAREISEKEYNKLELFSKSSDAVSVKPRPFFRRVATFVSRNEGETLRGLEGVQGAPRAQLTKEHRLALALREVNKMRRDRQSVNHEYKALFEDGAVWAKPKPIVLDVINENDSNDGDQPNDDDSIASIGKLDQLQISDDDSTSSIEKLEELQIGDDATDQAETDIANFPLPPCPEIESQQRDDNDDNDDDSIASIEKFEQLQIGDNDSIASIEKLEQLRIDDDATDQVETDTVDLPPRSEIEAQQGDDNDANESSDEADDSSVFDENDPGFMVYDDEEQQKELEEFELKKKQAKAAAKLKQTCVEEPMDIADD